MLSLCQYAVTQHEGAHTMSNDTIHVGIYDTWADWEPGYALAHLGSGDWQPDGKKYCIVTVGETRDPITTKGGMTLTPYITV